jgi:hypothetical protein
MSVECMADFPSIFYLILLLDQYSLTQFPIFATFLEDFWYGLPDKLFILDTLQEESLIT